MNRQQRRDIQRKLNKFSDEELYLIDILAKSRIEEFKENLYTVMRKNHISDKRANLIIKKVEEIV